MLKDVTLGQFFPGTSIVHRLDPRCKLLMTVVYIAALFTAENYVSYAAMLVVTGVSCSWCCASRCSSRARSC